MLGTTQQDPRHLSYTHNLFLKPAIGGGRPVRRADCKSLLTKYITQLHNRDMYKRASVAFLTEAVPFKKAALFYLALLGRLEHEGNVRRFHQHLASAGLELIEKDFGGANMALYRCRRCGHRWSIYRRRDGRWPRLRHRCRS